MDFSKIFSKHADGQPRVSSTKRVLDSIVPKLVEYFEKHEQCL